MIPREWGPPIDRAFARRLRSAFNRPERAYQSPEATGDRKDNLLRHNDVDGLIGDFARSENIAQFRPSQAWKSTASIRLLQGVASVDPVKAESLVQAVHQRAEVTN